MNWTTTWANATSRNDRRAENYAKNITLRYPVYNALSGESIRLTFSNLCGEEDVVLSRVTFAKTVSGNKIDAETLIDVTFSGEECVTIPVGKEVSSDEMDFAVEKGFYTVSVYLKEYTSMNSTVLISGPLSKGFFALGDETRAESLDFELVKGTNWVYFLNRLDVRTKEDKKGIICFGDSITAQAWPDYFAKKTERPVYRRAVCGTRILREYSCVNYASYGIRGDKRFYPEVSSCQNADTVIIQHGINDIIHPVGAEVNPYRPWSDLPTAEELIEGTKAYIRTARELGLKVYLGTLLPIGGWRTDAPFREELRVRFNEWMRTTDLVDGVIDFDRLLADPNRPAYFKSGYDSGDHLHPSAVAYEAMADEAYRILSE